MSQINLTENGSAPSTPSTGQVAVYAKTDKALYYKTDTGSEVGPIGPPSGSAGGDLAGTYPNPGVAALQGNAVAATLPAPGDVLTWNSGTSQWEPQAPSGGGGTGVTANTTIWVQTSSAGGNDATGTRGDSTKPFATINAALNAIASNSDVIRVGPGNFTTPPLAFPGGFSAVTIVGCGANLTSIGTTDVTSPLLSPTAATTFLTIQDVALNSKNTSCVYLDGTGAGGTYLLVCKFINVDVTSTAAFAFYAKFVSGLVLENVRSLVSAGPVTIDTCKLPLPCVGLQDLAGQGLSVGFDSTSVDAPSPRTTSYFKNINFSNKLVLTGHPDVNFDSTCRVGGIRPNIFSPLTVNGALAPTVVFSGISDAAGSDTGVLFTTALPDDPAAQVWNFDNAKIKGDDGFGNSFVFGVTVGGVNPQTVTCRNAEILPGSNVTANNVVTINARGVDPSCNFGGSGIITASQIVGSRSLPASGGLIAWGTTCDSPPVSVVLQLVGGGPGATAVGNLTVTARTTSTFTVAYTGVAAAEFVDYVLSWRP